MAGLLQIGADEVDEVLGDLLRGEGVLAGLQHVLADVVFEDLAHEAVDAAADVGEQHEDVGAVGVAGEGALDGIDLAADALDAGEEFFVLTMAHFASCLYPRGIWYKYLGSEHNSPETRATAEPIMKTECAKEPPGRRRMTLRCSPRFGAWRH